MARGLALLLIPIGTLNASTLTSYAIRLGFVAFALGQAASSAGCDLSSLLHVGVCLSYNCRSIGDSDAKFAGEPCSCSVDGENARAQVWGMKDGAASLD
jgi:hypothetical protein